MILLVSDLLVPAAHAADLLRALPLPGLCALLRSAHHVNDETCASSIHAPLPDVDWVLRTYLPASAPPATAAGLLMLRDLLPPPPGPVALLTPCHYALARDHVQLGILADDIADDEAAALGVLADEACNAHGLRLHRPSAQRWYLEGLDTSALQTVDPRRALGRNVDLLLPSAHEAPEVARQWRRLHTEIQMLWHHHRVNLEREARGAPAINGLWLQTACPPPPNRPAVTPTPIALRASQPLLAALAHYVQAHTLPAQIGVPAFVWLDELAPSAAMGDWTAWRTALLDLERTWFAPLATRGEPLTLVLTGESHRRTWTRSARSRWAFWRNRTLMQALAT